MTMLIFYFGMILFATIYMYVRFGYMRFLARRKSLALIFCFSENNDFFTAFLSQFLIFGADRRAPPERLAKAAIFDRDKNLGNLPKNFKSVFL